MIPSQDSKQGQLNALPLSYSRHWRSFFILPTQFKFEKGISAISISAVVPCQRQGGYHLWKRVLQTTAIAYGSVCCKPQFNTDECSGFEAGTSVSHCTGQFILSDQLNALATTKNTVYSTQFVATRITTLPV